jgi:hypothetical protein
MSNIPGYGKIWAFGHQLARQVIRQSGKGVPQWYKERLLKSAFKVEP